MHCKDCGKEWSADAFYVSNRTQCKECIKRRVRNRSRVNPKVQEYDRRRAKEPDRVKRATVVTKKWRASHPEAASAQRKVAYEIRCGRLTAAPCAICGTTEHVHAHHKDYSKPLDVTWLCARCHQRLHAVFPELGGNFAAAESR